MGCNNTKEIFEAVENRVNAIEAQLKVTPNEFTHAKVVQVLEEKYGQASQELVRLQKIMELMNQSEALIAASKNMTEAASKMENLSIRMVGVRVEVTQVGLVLLYGSRGDSIFYNRDGKNLGLQIADDHEYDLPGEIFTYQRENRTYGKNSGSYRCYFNVLK